MAPPFRMDHIGSLLRPQALLEAKGAGEGVQSYMNSASQTYQVADGKLKQAEKQAIEGVARKQLELNIRPITSGEYCRHMFYSGFFETLEGMSSSQLRIPEDFRTDFPTTTKWAKRGAKERPAIICTGPIGWKKSAYLEEWNMLRGGVPESSWKDLKITFPAPSYQHIQLKPGTAFTKASGYSNDEEYFQALGKAYQAEIKALYDAGCRNIQIDDPHLTYFCDEGFLAGCAKDGTDTEALLDLYLEAHNYFLRSTPADLHMGMHLCRGNMRGGWVTGSYEKIAQKLFSKTDYNTYYLEFDDAAHTGGFEPLRFLPRDKNVVLGLVSTKKADMEDREELKKKIELAAEAVAQGQGVPVKQAMDSLAISPQCGFSSSALVAGEGMTWDLMWKKLELVRDVAKEAWATV